MRHGYSNILGELVVADVLDYGDCEQFQIVCPNCREPLFKRIRGDTHYFAHYQENKSLQAECELRVRNFTAADIDAKSAFARDQRLRYFLAELTTLLRESPNSTQEETAWREETFGRMRRVAEFKWWVQIAWEWLNEPDTNIEEITKAYAANVYESWDTIAWAPKTSFGREQQVRAATDMLRTLATPLGRSAMDKAINAAWCDLLRVVDNMLKKGVEPDFSEPVRLYMTAVTAGAANTASAAHRWLVNTPPPSRLLSGDPRSKWSDVFFNHLMEALVAVLLSLDYMASLRKRAGKAH